MGVRFFFKKNELAAIIEMKIALIGNMNNNNFAILRYFRDLGADAHLLLYANDGQGELRHFKPESDTWEIDRWAPYIHQTHLPNSQIAALDFPLSWLMSLRSHFRYKLGSQEHHIQSIGRSLIKETLGPYQKFVASGIAPAIFHRANINLDIFYPYSNSVEFVGAGDFTVQWKKANKLKKLVLEEIRSQQSLGISNSRIVINSQMGNTEEVLQSLGVQPMCLAIPMVYNRENAPSGQEVAALGSIISRLNNSSFSMMSHSRLMWKKPETYSADEWKKESKNNDWLLYAFREVVSSRKHLNPLLLLLEYGPDVDATKQLCSELQLDANVMWLPIMERKYLLSLLDRVDVGVGQFYDIPGMLWGGTGWESLACGKPLLQGFQFGEGEYERLYGYSPPPMLPVRCEADLLPNILGMADNPNRRDEMGRDAKKWFDTHNGIGLAKKWLDLLMTERKI